MCGIAAWAGQWNREDVEHLLMLAAQRGPHAWGLANLDWRAAQLGRFEGHVSPTVPVSGMLLGHARLATSAGRTALEAVQPLLIGDIAIAHNGTVPDVDAWHLPWSTGNDSEVLGQWLIRQAGCSWSARLRGLAARLRRPYALAVLTTGGGLWVMRRGHPLFVRPGFACSRPFTGATGLLEEDTPFRLQPNSTVSAPLGRVVSRTGRELGAAADREPRPVVASQNHPGGLP